MVERRARRWVDRKADMRVAMLADLTVAMTVAWMDVGKAGKLVASRVGMWVVWTADVKADW